MARSKVSKEVNFTLKIGTHFTLDITSKCNLIKILRITVLVKGFIRNIKKPHGKMLDPLSADKILIAEEYWIKKIQEHYFLFLKNNNSR